MTPLDPTPEPMIYNLGIGTYRRTLTIVPVCSGGTISLRMAVTILTL